MREVTTDVRWLDATQQRAWRGFLDLHARLSAKLNRDLQQTSGLTLSDYDVLVHLTDVPEGRLRAFELSDGLQWDKSRVSKQVARLAARGLVAKQECEADRRGAYVVLTPTGRAAIEAAAPAHVELVHRLIFDTLTPGQVREWATISAALLRRVELGDQSPLADEATPTGATEG
jgi:DNA-binding MarR family transcriptional regulator